LKTEDLIGEIRELEPADRILSVDQNGLDQIAHAFARVIDAKSPFTFMHSERVTEIVMRMAGSYPFPHQSAVISPAQLCFMILAN
jgi:HD-GYP domain-containing protein (c-di-GMP phosphodiesterase class II)